MNPEERNIVLLCVATDLLCFWFALHVASLSIFDTLATIDLAALNRDRILAAAVFGSAMAVAGAYWPWRLTDRFDAVYFALMAAGATVFLLLLAATLLPTEWRAISRREIVISCLLAGLLVGAWRMLAPPLLRRFQSLHRNFYVLGDPAEGSRIAESIRDARGVYADAEFVSVESLAARVASQGPEQDQGTLASSNAIIALSREHPSDLIPLLTAAEVHCRRTFLHPSVNDALLFRHQQLLAVAGVPLIEVATFPLRSPYLLLKRLIDIAAASLGLLLSAPICLIAAIAIQRTSPGGMLFTQERLGQHGRPFKLYKFRSMFTQEQSQEDAAAPVLATENDPRVTPVGRFLRRHRIDEIPQLYNVLVGDMSLVGPRPVWTSYYDELRAELPLIDRRLLVRPGLTGLAHVLGSYTSEPADRLRYDLVYISTMSLLTDVRILIATVRIVLSGKGAL